MRKHLLRAIRLSILASCCGLSLNLPYSQAARLVGSVQSRYRLSSGSDQAGGSRSHSRMYRARTLYNKYVRGDGSSVCWRQPLGRGNATHTFLDWNTGRRGSHTPNHSNRTQPTRYPGQCHDPTMGWRSGKFRRISNPNGLRPMSIHKVSVDAFNVNAITLAANASAEFFNTPSLSSYPRIGHTWYLKSLQFRMLNILNLYPLSTPASPPPSQPFIIEILKNGNPIFYEDYDEPLIPVVQVGEGWTQWQLNADLGGEPFRSGDQLTIRTQLINPTTTQVLAALDYGGFYTGVTTTSYPGSLIYEREP